LAGVLTGVYRADVVMEDDRQRLSLTLECRPPPRDAENTIAAIYPALVRAIGKAQPEFMDDWNNIYRKWDDDPRRRILRIEIVPWPSLSEGMGDRIKRHSFGE
jgi:phenylacetate-CoA ligase